MRLRSRGSGFPWFSFTSLEGAFCDPALAAPIAFGFRERVKLALRLVYRVNIKRNR